MKIQMKILENSTPNKALKVMGQISEGNINENQEAEFIYYTDEEGDSQGEKYNINSKYFQLNCFGPGNKISRKIRFNHCFNND